MILSSFFYTSVLQYPCKIHSLIKKPIYESTQVILYIHGTYATSYGFVDFMKQLHHLDPNIEIHALDLVGFGISNIINKDKEKKVASFTCEEIIDFYASYIKEYIDKTNLNKNKNVIIIGHSFGGFLSIHFSHRYPQYLHKLILVSPCGIFPMLGEYGNYWALFFKTNMMYYIHSIMRYINLLRLFSSDNNSYIIAKQNNYGCSFVNRFIHCGFGCKCKNICIDKIIYLFYNPHIEVYFIYGEHDSIIPWQQGKTLYDVFEKKCDYIIIPDAYHAPYIENCKEFCKNMFYIIQNKQNKQTIELKQDIKEKTTMVKNILEKYYSGSYFPWITRKIIKHQNNLLKFIFSYNKK